MRKPTLLVFGAAAAALAVAGCGGGGSSSSSSASSAPASTPAPAAASTPQTSGGSQTLKLSADPSGKLAFDKTSLSAKAGKVTITMANPAQIPHGVAIKGGGANQAGQIVQKGGTSTVTVTLKPGKYEFFCPVPGHEQAGMKGTLTVQ